MLSFLFFSGCDEFTVDSCSPDPSQTINTGSLPNDGEQTGICQDLCNRQTDCAYWSVFCPPLDIETCTCTLYGYSYLHSCQQIGGDKDTAIEVSLIGDNFQIKKRKAVITSKILRSLLFSLKKCGKVKVNFTTMRKSSKFLFCGFPLLEGMKAVWNF